MTVYKRGDEQAAGAATAAPRPSGASQSRSTSAGTVLASGTTLEGALHALEPVRIAGTLEGTLEVEDAVTIELGGRLVAGVVATEVIVAGVLDGEVQCRGCLDVRASGVVKGTVRVGRLRIEDGALLDGQFQMQGAIMTAALEPTLDPAPPAKPTSHETAS